MVVLCSCTADRCNLSPAATASNAGESLHDMIGSGDGSGDGSGEEPPAVILVRRKREVPLIDIDDETRDYQN